MGGRTLAIILAAGQGTRMRSKLPKVMHPVGGLAMVEHVLAAAREAGVDDTALVVAPGATWPDAVLARNAGASAFTQEAQNGTADAVLAARGAFEGPDVGAVVVLFGDNPLITGGTIARVLGAVADGADVAVLGFETAEPYGYGRILRDGDGQVVAIREEKDATDEERLVTLCNSGVMAIRAGAPLQGLDEIGNDNAKGEFYLTDIVAIGRENGWRMVCQEADFAEVMGVNDRAQLAVAEAEFQRRARARVMEGATLQAPETVFFSYDTVIGDDVTIEPNVVFGLGVSVGDGCRVKAFTHLENTRLESDVMVGPFARSRGGASLASGVRIGNFVELKNAQLEAGAKVSHLTYLGDASVGAGANIGAGTITCNYDGANKHRTEIGAGAFIGSNSALVAPVVIGDHAFVGSGSVITDDVPADALAIARGRQATKPGRSPAKREKA